MVYLPTNTPREAYTGCYTSLTHPGRHIQGVIAWFTTQGGIYRVLYPLRTLREAYTRVYKALGTLREAYTRVYKALGSLFLLFLR